MAKKKTTTKKAPAKKSAPKKPAAKKAPEKKSAVPKSGLTGVPRVGEVAGEVWHYLDGGKNSTLSQLVKEIDAPRDEVMQAVGWLAREGKVDIHENGRSKSISLT